MAYVKTEIDGNIGIITLNRPEKLNAMTRPMYREISDELIKMDAAKDIWVIIVRSSTKKAFSTGADLELLHTVLTDGPFEWNPMKPDRFDFGLRVSKPVIASVEGYCLAGGLELALSCDIRIATRDSIFGAPEVKWSVLHGFGSLMLPRLTSLGKTMELMMTGETITGEEAERFGIVNKVVDSAELETATREMARKICNNGPIAVRMIKELTLQGLNMSLHDGLRLYKEMNRTVHASADAVEGMNAWRDRRPAKYTNN